MPPRGECRLSVRVKSKTPMPLNVLNLPSSISARMMAWVFLGLCVCTNLTVAQEVGSEVATGLPVTGPPSRIFDVRLEVLQKVDIACKIDGFLTFADLTPGKVLTAGTVLAKLDTNESKLEIRRLEAEISDLQLAVQSKAEQVTAEQNLKTSRYRLSELKMASGRTQIPQLEMVEAETKYLSDEAALDAATTDRQRARYRLDAKIAEQDLVKLQLERSVVTAPFDGIVFKQFKHAGEAVSPTEPLAEIYRLDYVMGSVLLKLDDISPSEFVTSSGTVRFETPDDSVELPFDQPQALPRIERDGRFLAVVRVKNSKRKFGWLLFPGMTGTLTLKNNQPLDR